MSKKKIVVMMSFLMGIIMVLALICCENPSGSGPAPFVDPFAGQEPVMSSNPSRSAVRAGGTAQIAVPEYMLDDPYYSVRASGANATFEVFEADKSIAQIVSQNGSSCKVKGLQMGTARIIIKVGYQTSTVIINVAPTQAFYTVPAGQVVTLGDSTFYNAWWASNYPDGLPNDYENYFAEPTYQLAWNWRNPPSSHGASGTDCGIDILAYFVDPTNGNRRGWVRTAYGHGGWHYDLNGHTNNMYDGVQTEGDLKLELVPVFVFDNGVPYLEITHKLTNTGTGQLTDVKFGASSDIMIYGRDNAPLVEMDYGALMTNAYYYYDTLYEPTMKIRLICQNVADIDDVSTLWFGHYGSERNYVYVDNREEITVEHPYDSAMNFSYQNINLNAGQTKTYKIRFTQLQ